MELKLLTLMQPLLFPRKFKCGFSVTEPNTREARVPRGSDKKQTLRSECCSVIAVFPFQIFLQQQIMFIVWKLYYMVHTVFCGKKKTTQQQLTNCNLLIFVQFSFAKSDFILFFSNVKCPD